MTLRSPSTLRNGRTVIINYRSLNLRVSTYIMREARKARQFIIVNYHVFVVGVRIDLLTCLWAVEATASIGESLIIENRGLDVGFFAKIIDIFSGQHSQLFHIPSIMLISKTECQSRIKGIHFLNFARYAGSDKVDIPA